MKERIELFSINQDGKVGQGDIGHDKIDPIFWEIKPVEHMVNKIPFMSIKSFFKVDLESHKALLALRDGHCMNDLLGQNDIITSCLGMDG